MHGPGPAHCHRHRPREDTDKAGKKVGEGGTRESHFSQIHEDAFRRQSQDPDDDATQRLRRVGIDVPGNIDVDLPELRHSQNCDSAIGERILSHGRPLQTR